MLALGSVVVTGPAVCLQAGRDAPPPEHHSRHSGIYNALDGLELLQLEDEQEQRVREEYQRCLHGQRG
jgi:hypothetical protein